MPLYYTNPTPVQSALFSTSGTPNFNSAFPGESVGWTTTYDNIGITNAGSYLTLPIGTYQALCTLNFTGTSVSGAQIFIGIQVSASLQYLQASPIEHTSGGSITFSHSFEIEEAGNFAITGYRGNAAVTAALNVTGVRSSLSIVKLS